MYKKESNKYFFINIFDKIVSLPVNLASFMVDAADMMFTSKSSSSQSEQVPVVIKTNLHQNQYQIRELIKINIKENLSLQLVYADADAYPDDNGSDDTDRIIAAIVSVLLVGSGVCLITISGGSLTPGMYLCSQLLMNTGK